MYPQNLWYVAAWRHEVTADALLGRTIGGEPIVLYRTGQGRLVALRDQCPHRSLPLSLGRREGDDLRCMYHGLKFSPDGRCISVPGQDLIPPQCHLRRFAVAENGSWVWVWLGQPELADPATIPYSVSFDDAKWDLRYASIAYDADYQLVNDNLTDFSHLTFVHETTIGRGGKHAETKPEVRAIDGGVGISRWLVNNANVRPNAAQPLIDVWSDYSYLAPGIMYKILEIFMPGTAVKMNMKAPDGSVEPMHAQVNSQAVTPVSPGKSLYFFAVGPAKADDTDGTLSDRMFALTQGAFHEDKLVVEAQQRSLDAFTPRQRVSIGHDKGPVLMRRAIEKLLSAERAEAASARLPDARVFTTHDEHEHPTQPRPSPRGGSGYAAQMPFGKAPITEPPS